MSRQFFGRLFLLFFLYANTCNMLFAITNWRNGQVITASVNDQDLQIFGDGYGNDATIEIQEAVYINAHNTDINVTVTANNVTLQTDSGYYAHLIFHANENRNINVYCDYDLIFKAPTNALNTNDFTLTFSGAGTTTFFLKDYNSTADSTGRRGAQVSFEGAALRGYNYPSEPHASISTYNPCRVYILMDQTEDDALMDGKNKVVFKRNPGGYAATTQYPKNPVGIHIDDNTMFTYISTDATGANGYGSVAFDPTHTGSGMMYIDIDQKNNGDAGHGGFNDGALVIYGHYCENFTEAKIRTATSYDTLAGKKAIFRVIDDTRYSRGITNPSDSDARGLLIINRNTTIPKFAADPYQEDILMTLTNVDTTHPLYNVTPADSKYWADIYSWNTAQDAMGTIFDKAKTTTYNVQTGFILGKNGRIEVAHKTFLDYVATLTNTKIDPYLAQDYSSVITGAATTQLNTSPYLKKKNPTAMFIDGLYEGWNSLFPANPQDADYSDAEIYLYGDSKLLLHAGSKATTVNSDAYVRPVYVENGDYIFTFTIASGTYNGQYISSSQVTSDEGRHVLDLEAPLNIKSYGRNSLAGHGSYTGDSTLDEAELNLPTVSTNFTGREYNFITSAYINRPLTKDTVAYKIYDSPSILLNSNLMLTGIVYNNNDITKILSPNPSIALPNVVGGERKYFNDTINPDGVLTPMLESDYAYPRFEFFNSRLDLHEHYVAAGCKFVVNEVDTSATVGSNNNSTFKFFNHGDDLDTLDHSYGRLFMATTSNNKMSNGSTNATLQNCSLNIFRKYDKTTPASTIKLSLQSQDESGLLMGPLLDARRPHHLLMFNRGSSGIGYMSLGWTTTHGDNSVYPWESLSGLSSNYFDINVTTTAPEGTTNTPPATLSIDGNYFYFGGTDSSGNKAVVPVITTETGSVVYVNHGGRITATQPSSTTHGYDAFVDLPIVYTLWSYDGLMGIVDLPKDQVLYGYGFGQQPYNLNTVDTDAGAPVGTHLDTFNSQRVQGYSGRITNDRYSGEEYIIAWNKRVDENTPVKSMPLFKTISTRYTAIIDEPVTMPANVIYFGAGSDWADIVMQLKVAGATMADPLSLLIDGYADGPGYAWVKEIVSIPSSPVVYGEGDHGIIFLRNGGRVGLGNNSWNQHSINSWKLLGKDYLTISPAGDGTVDLNSNIYVIDRGAFVAEDSFGATEVNRLTINLNGNVLYVPANGELDLSSFGQNTYRQEIQFAGEGRVVLGHGATIRFPATVTPTSVDNYPVLYFNDSTRLEIEDDPEVAKAKYSDPVKYPTLLSQVTASDLDKVKIVGKGQIWLNKDAKFEVMDGAKVRVGSDDYTPDTYLRLSIQRQGDFVLGDEQEAGGSFEVGNPVAITGGEVNFELSLNGAKARTHLDRGGFLGIGVGVIDNSYDHMNGDSTLAANPVVDQNTGNVYFTTDPTNAWKVQTLYDVKVAKILNYQGIFDHSNIFNGSNRLAAMVAFGPISESYTLELTDPDSSKILGGGNIMYLDRSTSDPTETYPIAAYINAWDFADPILRQKQQPSDPEDYGMYNMLASDMIVQQQVQANFTNSTITKLAGGGIRLVTAGTDKAYDLFKFLSTPKWTDLGSRMVNCGASQYRVYIGYVNTAETDSNYSYANANQIYRETGFSMARGSGKPEDGVEIGVLGTTGATEPVTFTTVNRR